MYSYMVALIAEELKGKALSGAYFVCGVANPAKQKTASQSICDSVILAGSSAG